VTPYVHVLFGGAHASISVGGSSGSVNAFAFALGGGVDAKLTHAVAFRVAQFDYLLTKFSDGIDDRQNNVRISTGIVFRWGGK
jgi:opacity protein-like surface antigen